VLHHDDGVPQIAQNLQGGQQPLGVPGVQADAGLIQNIKNAGELGADLGGQADALGLAPGQGGGGPLQGQVIQTHLQQKPQALADFFQHPPGDFLLPGGQGETVNQSWAWATLKRVTSLMWAPPIFTARASRRSLAPWQSGQGRTVMNCSISSRTKDESVSW
jgi:hypothetical protein